MQGSQLHAIFARILEYPPNEREAALRDHCAGDERLLADCRRLLGALGAADANRFLAAEGVPPGEDPLLQIGERRGDRIGPYKLLEIVGEGGFGVVWLAERREPMVQRVALKIIKPGMDSRAVIARFEQERQALAVMDHPNIARVLDGGVTPAGRPYFVMEHVSGEPITGYCDRLNLTIGDRLELFTSVCAAVQHAHTKGVIHRDIKPSNILVGEHDGRPVPKVIDFGIAKAVSGTLIGATVFTEAGQLIGTPEYMSPEQAGNAAPDDIDTRTDVYSLGVVLYELLTGSQPFDSNMLRAAGRAAIERIICETDPPRPSTRLSTLGQRTAEVARARRTGPRELESQLRRELEWIPLKALRKDRRERYRSPSELADDVLNYLAHRPLIAGPESAAYKARKFARRNKGAVSAAGVITASMVVATVVSVWFAMRERTQRSEAQRLQGVAEVNAEAESRARKRAEVISNFMTITLRSSDPMNDGEQDATIIDAMTNAIREVESGAFAYDPETEAALRLTIAIILMNNGRAADAEPPAVKALAALRVLHPGDHAAVGNGLNQLAMVLDTLGRSREAEPLFVEALDMNRRLFPGDHQDIATGLDNLSQVRKRLGHLQNAEVLQQQSLDMRQRLFKGDHREVAASLTELADIQRLLGRDAEAEPLYERSLEMYRRLYPGDEPRVAAGLNSVAVCRQAMGRTAEAEPLLTEALDMQRRMFHGDHPHLAASLSNLAAVRMILGRPADAEPLLIEGLEMNRRLFGPNHAEVAQGLQNLAAFYRGQGRLAEAEPLCLQSIEVYRALYPGDHLRVASSLNGLATLRHTMGRSAEAESLLVEALEMDRRLLNGDHHDIVMVLHNLALVRLSLGRPAEAEPLFAESLAMCDRLYRGADHPATAAVMSSLARCLAALDRLEEASRLAETAAAMAGRLFPEGHPSRKKCDDVLADIQKGIARHQESNHYTAPYEHPALNRLTKHRKSKRSNTPSPVQSA